MFFILSLGGSISFCCCHMDIQSSCKWSVCIPINHVILMTFECAVCRIPNPLSLPITGRRSRRLAAGTSVWSRRQRLARRSGHLGGQGSFLILHHGSGWGWSTTTHRIRSSACSSVSLPPQGPPWTHLLCHVPPLLMQQTWPHKTGRGWGRRRRRRRGGGRGRRVRWRPYLVINWHQRPHHYHRWPWARAVPPLRLRGMLLTPHLSTALLSVDQWFIITPMWQQWISTTGSFSSTRKKKV